MRVVGVPSDTGACGHLRIAWPVEVAVQEGVSAAVTPSWEIKIARDTSNRIIGFKNLPEADVYVFQRLGTAASVDMVRTLKQVGAAVILDLDDDLSRVDQDNAAWREWNGYNTNGAHWRYTMQVADEVDLVTVTTPRLADRFAKHGRFAVVPNCLPEAAVIDEPERSSDGSVRVGWAGTVHTHPHDLKVTGGAVERAMRGSDALLRVIGGEHGVKEGLGRAPDEVVEWVHPSKYPAELSALDVGLVPLDDTTFNQAKSGLKMLDYAGAGAVPVGTPTWDNKRVHKTGIGLLARTPKEWEQHINRLLTDDAFRVELAEQSQQSVKDNHLIQRNVHRWTDAWERAWERAQSRGRSSSRVPTTEATPVA